MAEEDKKEKPLGEEDDSKEAPKPESKPESKPQVKSNILKSADDYAIVYKFINAYKKGVQKKLFKPNKDGKVKISDIITAIKKNHLVLDYTGEPTTKELQDAYQNAKTITGKGEECMDILSNDPSILASEYNKYKIEHENNVEASRENVKISAAEYKESAKINRRQKANRNLGYIGKGIVAVAAVSVVASPAIAVLSVLGGIAGLAATGSLGLVTIGVAGTYALYKGARKFGGILFKKLDNVINKAKAIIDGDEKVKGSKKHKAKARELEKQNRKELYNYNAMTNSYEAKNAEAIRALEEGAAEMQNDWVNVGYEAETENTNENSEPNNPNEKENTSDGDKKDKATTEKDKQPDGKKDEDTNHPDEVKSKTEKLIKGDDLWSGKNDWQFNFENSHQRKELILDSIYDTIGINRSSKKEIKNGSDVHYDTLLGINSNVNSLASLLDGAYKDGKVPDGKTKQKIFSEIKKLENNVKTYKSNKNIEYTQSDYNSLIDTIDQKLEDQTQVNAGWQALDNLKSNLKKVDGKENKYVTDELVKKYIQNFITLNLADDTYNLNDALNKGLVSDIGLLESWNKLDLEKREPVIKLQKNAAENEAKQLLDIINQRRPDDFTKSVENFINNKINVKRSYDVFGKFGSKETADYKQIPNVTLEGTKNYNASEILNAVNSGVKELVDKNTADKKQVEEARNTFNNLDSQFKPERLQNNFSFRHIIASFKEKHKNDRAYVDNDISMFIDNNVINNAIVEFVKNQLELSDEIIENLPEDKKKESLILIKDGVKSITDFYNKDKEKDITKIVGTNILLKGEKDFIVLSPEDVNKEIVNIINSKIETTNKSWDEFESNKGGAIVKEMTTIFTPEAAKLCIKNTVLDNDLKFIDGLEITEKTSDDNQISLDDAVDKIYDFYTAKKPKDPFIDAPKMSFKDAKSEIGCKNFAEKLGDELSTYKEKADNKAKVQGQIAEAIKQGETTYGNVVTNSINALSNKFFNKDNIANYVAGTLSVLTTTNPNNDAYTFNDTKKGETAHLCALFGITEKSNINQVKSSQTFGKIMEYLKGKVKDSSNKYLPFDYSTSTIKGEKYDKLNLEALILDIGDNCLDYGNWLKNQTIKEYNQHIADKSNKKITKFKKRIENPSLFDRFSGKLFTIKNSLLNKDEKRETGKIERENKRITKIQKLIDEQELAKINKQKAYEISSLEM